MVHSPHTLLTRREREIMDAVFTLGNRASAEQIRECLINPPSDSAVLAMLARLEKKGYLKHQYDQEAVLRDFYADGDDMVVFRKRLTLSADRLSASPKTSL